MADGKSRSSGSRDVKGSGGLAVDKGAALQCARESWPMKNCNRSGYVGSLSAGEAEKVSRHRGVDHQ